MLPWILLAVFVLIAIRAPIFVALGAPAMAYLALKGVPLALAPQRMIGTINDSILAAIPMFLLAGRLMNFCGATERIFNFAEALIGYIRGGLGYVAVLASMIFSAMSGSAAADAVGVGTITVKAMRERGYDPAYAAGVTLSSSPLAPIIPPSIIMIIFGATANISIGRLFIGGIMPGLMIFALLMLTVMIVSWKRKYPKGDAFSMKRLVRTFWRASAVLVTPVLIIGGIFSGTFTPTEAGVIAVVYVIILGMFYRSLSFANFYREVVGAGTAVGALLLVVSVSGLDGWVFAREQLPMTLANHVMSLTTDPTAILVLILLVVLVLGMFMDATPIILMVVPAIMPLVSNTTIDPIHLGVLFCITCVIGLITPPVGVALYGVAMVSRLPVERVFLASMPFFAALFGSLVLLIFFPQIATFLPNLILGE
ncbi:TRAP transporter large permease [Halomonas dongshanensis]|uniref:TRAP transporter large permease protein n=1 Tax=Halomonas dongshanensis TaxID=2890835 RepID=A0ABT2EAY8_9GAMM|nr:TRAP transporter large permease [Halomonas dongshanensis]MCS2608741.1 TRAP transporter large permease [Halomonas dongshanensis]